jgi:hypothetical protein
VSGLADSQTEIHLIEGNRQVSPSNPLKHTLKAPPIRGLMEPRHCYANANPRKGEKAKEIFRFIDLWALQHDKPP